LKWLLAKIRATRHLNYSLTLVGKVFFLLIICSLEKEHEAKSDFLEHLQVWGTMKTGVMAAENSDFPL